jgi:hypothetical protein
MPTEQEPNNNSVAANALTLGTSITGQLASHTDIELESQINVVLTDVAQTVLKYVVFNT